MSSNKEHKLIEGIVNNDYKTISKVYHANYNLVKTLVINNSGSEDDAQDIYQDSMMVLIDKLNAGMELNCKISSFLYSVARNLWLKRLKKDKLNQQLTKEDIIPIEEDLDLYNENEQKLITIKSALKSLGERCQELLEKYYLNNLRMAEIANQMGYTNADNVKNQKYKCFKKLKSLLGK